MGYTFGDSDFAAKRLKVLADVFCESTREFLSEALDAPPELALDLGCGPGYTTRLLQETIHSPRTVGLDSSENFISLARDRETDSVSFQCHDVTQAPFPTGPVDAIYCRFLLTHLSQPQEALSAWVSQLRAVGVLLIEELNSHRSYHPVFSTYLDIVPKFLADQGQTLYIGSELSALCSDLPVKERSNQVRIISVPRQASARLFTMNIRTWKHLPFVQNNFPAEMISQLEADLLDLAAQPDSPNGMEWDMRQMVFQQA